MNSEILSPLILTYSATIHYEPERSMKGGPVYNLHPRSLPDKRSVSISLRQIIRIA